VRPTTRNTFETIGTREKRNWRTDFHKLRGESMGNAKGSHTRQADATEAAGTISDEGAETWAALLIAMQEQEDAEKRQGATKGAPTVGGQRHKRQRRRSS
jgi:hypothetical protein